MNPEKSLNQIQDEKADRDSMKIVINLFDKVVEEEELSQEEVNIEKTLVQLIDDFLKKRNNLTNEQKQILAKV